MMVRAQSHRGPDGEGFYLDDWIGLGHSRLSIIDLAGGNQPITDEDGALWIVFNGEIFNYLELKRDLESRGHRFRTSTDTEVIVHLYEDLGEACLDKLNGQFAFAIWDSKAKNLFLARDRLGILPLHYALSDGFLVFSSEIKGIFSSGLMERSVDPLALDQIFTFWTTLRGRTAFRNVHEVPPGHYLNVSGNTPTLKCYWDFPCSNGEVHHGLTLEKAVEEVAELIRDAVRIRLRADVPVGCYISGGLDSSGITALVKKHFNHKARSFGIRFEDREFDEREHQDAIVSHLRLDHTAFEARNEEIRSCFPSVVWHAEKPLLRTAPVPLYLLSNVVRKSGYKVVLTGEGADEIFGGYNIFKETKIRAFWAKKPRSSSRPLLLARLYPYVFKDRRVFGNLMSFFGKGLDRVDDPFFSHMVRWQNTSRLKLLFSEDLKDQIGGYDVCRELAEGLPEVHKTGDHFSRAQYLEATIFLSNYLLSSQGDRVAMAHGVEIRPPFLDHRIVEFMARIPSNWKMRGLNEKYLLKKVLQPILPKPILERPKHPYRAPVGSSLLGEGNKLFDGVLSVDSLTKANLFDAAKIGRLTKKLEASRYSGEFDNMALAGVLSTQIVYDRFIRRFESGGVDERFRPANIVDRRSAARQIPPL